jgi:glycosyltransferase involved in cell wall biosynthesis
VDSSLDKRFRTATAVTGDRRAAVITPFFADHDAVGNDVRHGAAALRRHGWDARVFAVGGESGLEAVHPLAELAGFLRAPSDLAYYHFSTGRRDVLDAVAALRCRRILKFHNITPPELFSMWSDELAEASRAGRAEMRAVAQVGWERVWADSSFNLSEIAPHLHAGTPGSVLAPFHEADALRGLGIARAAAAGPPSLLTVGRIAPSKGHAFLLRALDYLVHTLATPARLDIVGKPDPRLLAYGRVLELMVRELGLDSFVTFHGEVAPEALARRYAQAAVFVLASEHEGFCVPLVEAMAFGVPVVALATTAVPETLGEAGIAWEERDPRRFAVSIQRLLREQAEREWLGAQGLGRYEASFTNRAIEDRMMAELGG